jgi:hypothetical protein
VNGKEEIPYDFYPNYVHEFGLGGLREIMK